MWATLGRANCIHDKSEQLPTVRFDFYTVDPEGNNTNNYTIELTNAIIVQMQTSLADGDLIREQLQLTFEEIEWNDKENNKLHTDSWKQQ